CVVWYRAFCWRPGHQSAPERVPKSAIGNLKSGGSMAYKWKVMLCLIPAFTLAALDLTIVNVALAKLSAVFGVDVATVGWTITGFALATGGATPVASFAETRFTTKRVWVATLVLFTAGSLLCGLAPAFWVLVVARVAQGASVGILSPLAVSLLFRVFPENERGGAF